MSYYGMFTEAGNQAIDGLVTVAKSMELKWPEVYNALQVLGQNPKFAEATDTAVREYVYDALEFETEFYI
jgi:osmotically-inducible protein OsmY